MLVSSEHVGDANYRVLHFTSVGLNRVTSIVLYNTVTAEMDERGKKQQTNKEQLRAWYSKVTSAVVATA